jgi:hypothetical protein
MHADTESTTSSTMLESHSSSSSSSVRARRCASLSLLVTEEVKGRQTLREGEVRSM